MNNIDRNTIDHFDGLAKTAYGIAAKYYTEDRVALAKMWELLAAYYQAIAYDTEPYPVLELFERYNDLEVLITKIDKLIDSSLPRNISKNSMGGFGYHGDTPIGETWGIVYDIAPNIAEIYQESNWDTFISELESVDPDGEYFTIERFASWASPTKNIMVRLIDDNGYPTLAAIKVVELLQCLEKYPYLDEDNVSLRESEQDTIEQLESIHSAVNQVWVNWDHPLATDKIDSNIWDFLYENDHEVIERSARGYQNSGYIKNDTAIHAAMYAMGLIDLTAYDSDDLESFENTLIEYFNEGISKAFSTYRTRLDR